MALHSSNIQGMKITSVYYPVTSARNKLKIIAMIARNEYNMWVPIVGENKIGSKEVRYSVSWKVL